MHIHGAASPAAYGRRDHPRHQQTEQAPEPSRDIAAGARVDTRAKLVLQTAEGDRVTISLEAHSKLAAASHTDAQSSSFAIEQSGTYKASINVKGELSDAEVEDISSLLQALAAATSGAQPPDTAELDTIAGYHYRQQQSVRAGAYFSLAA